MSVTLMVLLATLRIKAALKIENAVASEVTGPSSWPTDNRQRYARKPRPAIQTNYSDNFDILSTCAANVKSGWWNHTIDQDPAKVMSDCNWIQQSITDISEPTFIFYQNNHDWNYSVNAWDMVPSDKWSWMANRQQLYPEIQDMPSDLMFFKCEAKGERKETEGPQGDWHFQKIGPFITTGGYSWLHASMADILGISRFLFDAKDGIYITAHMTHIMDSDSNTIGFPPIHVHHIHVYSESQHWFKNFRLPFAESFNVRINNSVMEHHGEYMCQDATHGNFCLLETYMPTYAKLITTPLILNMDLNDVRAFDSEPLEWWFQISLQLTSRQNAMNVKPLSLHYLGNPLALGPNRVQKLLTFSVANQDSFLWYAGRMLDAGTLIRGRTHTHATNLNQTLLMAARITDLGLETQHFQPVKPGEPIPLQKTGFDKILDLRDYIIGKLSLAQDSHATACAENASSDDVTCPSWYPDIVCHTLGTTITVGAFEYDRLPRTCCKTWRFAKGDPFVAMIFFNQIHRGLTPTEPQVPTFIVQHFEWFLWYDAGKDSTYENSGRYVQKQDVVYMMDGSLWANMINFGGSGPNGVEMVDYLLLCSWVMMFVVGWKTAAFLLFGGVFILFLVCDRFTKQKRQN